MPDGAERRCPARCGTSSPRAPHRECRTTGRDTARSRRFRPSDDRALRGRRDPGSRPRDRSTAARTSRGLRGVGPHAAAREVIHRGSSCGGKASGTGAAMRLDGRAWRWRSSRGTRRCSRPPRSRGAYDWSSIMRIHAYLCRLQLCVPLSISPRNCSMRRGGCSASSRRPTPSCNPSANSFGGSESRNSGNCSELSPWTWMSPDHGVVPGDDLRRHFRVDRGAP